MADKPVIFDDDNPEWTDDDFARARSGADVLPPALVTALEKNRGGRPKGSFTSDRKQVALRIPANVIDHFKAAGPGWHTRMVETLEREAAKG